MIKTKFIKILPQAGKYAAYQAILPWIYEFEQERIS